MAEPTRFQRGHTVTRRYLRGPHVTWEQATTVVSDDDRGLVLWVPAGADFAHRIDADGTPIRTRLTIDGFGDGGLERLRWSWASVLIWHPAGAAHTVWWVFRAGRFDSWYVNLETPLVRRPDGIDIVDHHLDLVVASDRAWRWKDEDEFAEVIGRPGFWDERQARDIRAEGERAVAAVQAGVFPFDGTWCDFTPDPAWPRPELAPHTPPDRPRTAG